MSKFEKASKMINLLYGIDTWNSESAVYVSVWNNALSDTFDVCINEGEVNYYAEEYDKKMSTKSCREEETE